MQVISQLQNIHSQNTGKKNVIATFSLFHSSEKKNNLIARKTVRIVRKSSIQIFSSNSTKKRIAKLLMRSFKLAIARKSDKNDV